MPQSAKRKAPVICLHGFPGLAEDWDGVAHHLPDDRDVYSLSMPWVAGSVQPIDGFRSLLNFVVRAARETLSEPAHFVGHDLGGVALYWLSQTGFRPGIKSMTIISAPHPDAYRPFFASAEARPRVAYIDDILQSRDDVLLRKRLLSMVKGRDGAIAGRIGAALDATNFPSLRTLYAQIRQRDQQPKGQVGDVAHMPVAFIHSMDDRYIPASVYDDSALRFGAMASRLRLMGDSHYPHLTEPAQVASFAERFWHDLEA